MGVSGSRSLCGSDVLFDGLSWLDVRGCWPCCEFDVSMVVVFPLQLFVRRMPNSSSPWKVRIIVPKDAKEQIEYLLRGLLQSKLCSDSQIDGLLDLHNFAKGPAEGAGRGDAKAT